jgi:uncharacterized damage-inducible protein DinB
MTAIWAQYARYNRLANEKLYDACAALSEEERRRDLGAFFKSVHGTLNHLERAEMDRRIERFFAALPAGFLERSLRYVNNSGGDSADPVVVILPHFFNHQTHHRAQVHTLLSQLGRDPPVLDLHRVLRP